MSETADNKKEGTVLILVTGRGQVLNPQFWWRWWCSMDLNCFELTTSHYVQIRWYTSGLGHKALDF